MKKKWFALVSAVILLGAVIGLGALLADDKEASASDKFAVAAAVYPEMAQYPDESEFYTKTGELDYERYDEAYSAWWADSRALRQQSELEPGSLDGFLAETIPQFLSGAGSENRVYSPLNVYMALAMLAETTDGESREQVLSLLGSESLDILRAQADTVWKANYSDDGAVTSILAGSVWLNEDVSFHQTTLDTLANTYHASSYQGEMGSPELDAALQSWLNAQTGGMLADQVGEITLDAETVLALATTIWYRAKWQSEFAPEKNTTDTFHTSSGDAVCEFMHKSGSRTYYWGDRFSAAGLPLENSGTMWFLLPDEGTTPDELLADPQALEFLLSGGDWDNNKFLIVNLSVPKFDVSSQLDLRSGLQALGVTDVFEAGAADFSPMTKDNTVWVDEVLHGARVMIDEEGCSAAAYTVIPAPGAAMPPEEEVDFVLDRPFLFVLTGRSGLPLFVGVVNQPG